MILQIYIFTTNFKVKFKFALEEYIEIRKKMENKLIGFNTLQILSTLFLKIKYLKSLNQTHQRRYIPINL